MDWIIEFLSLNHAYKMLETKVVRESIDLIFSFLFRRFVVSRKNKGDIQRDGWVKSVFVRVIFVLVFVVRTMPL